MSFVKRYTKQIAGFYSCFDRVVINGTLPGFCIPTTKFPNPKRLLIHQKNIRQMVRKQLKKQFPNWKCLPKKAKKVFAKKVLAEVVSEYN